MDNNHSALRADLADAIHRLEDSLSTLDERLRAETGYPQWVWGEEYYDKTVTAEHRYRHMRDKARAVIQAIDYVDGQPKGEARICPALLGASRNTLAAARTVNQAKAEVEAALAPMRKIMVSDNDMETGKTIKVPLTKVALRALDHARFHYQQATRQLVVLDRAPESATFVWAVCPKITAITKAQAIKKLNNKLRIHGEERALLADLENVSRLRDSERLAVVRPPHIHPRANLVFCVQKQYVNKQCRGVMPVLYLAKQADSRPDMGDPLPEEPPTRSKRKKRRDAQLASEPYLPTIRVHRYET